MIAALGAIGAAMPGKSFNLSIVGGAVPREQRVMRVEKGDQVRLRVTSDAPGELHLHGNGLEVRLVKGGVGEFGFNAYATGRFPLEWHAAGAKARGGSHHGPPLATLEVRPK
jgi:hypothetical protein